MNSLAVLIVFLLAMFIAFAIPVMVTKFFVKDTMLAVKIVVANYLVMVLLNKLLA